MLRPENLNDLRDHAEIFLKRMGWWKNKTHLEALMLVVSECGEAANEVRGDVPTEHFAEELADIILRVLGISAENGIDIRQAVFDKMEKNCALEPRPDRLK